MTNQPRVKASRFAGTLLDDIGDTPLLEQEQASQPSIIQSPPKRKASAQVEQLTERGRGRPAGKRSSADWVAITTFAKSETLQAVDIAMIRLGRKRQLSNLIETLLEEWLQNPKEFKEF